MILNLFSGELHAPIKHNENGGSEHGWKRFPTLFLKSFRRKFGKQILKKGGRITHHDLFRAILQSTLKNTLFESKTESHILEGMY